MPEYGSIKRHPLVSLILLLLLILAGLFIFMIIGAICAGFIYGRSDVLKFFSGDISNLSLLKFMQIVSSIGMFVVPALFFARLESQNWTSFLKFNSCPAILFVLVLLMMVSFAPLMELSIEINKSMNLPSFMVEIENWMRNQEDRLAELTMQLLKMTNFTALAINLLMLAVLPALGEELIFRGCLQKIFTKMSSNYHVSVWLTAIIFSAFHMQFYGFLPRMLLGGLFGYLLIWSNSIWIPILAHFINNAIAVIMAYVFQRGGISLEEINHTDSYSPVHYMISFTLTAALLWLFYNQSYKKHLLLKQQNGTGLG